MNIRVKPKRHVELSDHPCKWPQVRSSDPPSCAALAVEGYPYCHDHCIRSYPAYAERFGIAAPNYDWIRMRDGLVCE